jgi:hypothetical protein
MRDLAARHYSKAAIIERDDLFFWLCHQRNLSNPAKIKRFPERLEVLKDRIGADAWGDTDDALNALKTRLLCESRGQAGSPGALISVPPQRAELRPKTTANYDKAVTSIPVSLMIKATVMDAPFLDIMVRHMIAQAGCSFSERAIVVDRQPALTGKYRSRPRSIETDLDRILDRLLGDGIVDHVRTVDMTPHWLETSWDDISSMRATVSIPMRPPVGRSMRRSSALS